MFYRPTFCCHCGEKITRAEQSFTDSTRFCDVCKHDFLALRLAPLILSSFLLLLGLAGAGGLMRRAPPQPVRSVPAATLSAPRPPETPRNEPTSQPPGPRDQRMAEAARPASSAVNRPRPIIVEEKLSMCGAPTKKGTPCTRKVRGGGRCWQHADIAQVPGPEKTPRSP